MKAGTTSVHRYLSQHPALFLPSVKEPNFFWLGGLPKHKLHPEVARDSTTERSAYEALFAPAGAGQRLGEASIGYLAAPNAAERIAALRPQAQLIAILRDPAERAWSHFVFNRERGDEPYDDFKRALVDEEARRATGLSGSRFAYRHHGFYQAHLSVYDKLFAKERLQIHLYEDLREDPTRMLQTIFRFLGVDADFEPDVSLRYNVSGVARHPSIAWALERGMALREPIVRRLPPRVAARIGTLLRRRPESLDREIRADLVSGYRDDILRLQDRIGRDLGSWLR